MTRSTGPTVVQRRAVYDRAQGLCEVCRVQVPAGTPPHHRRPRGMGGSSVPWINDPSNLLLLCMTEPNDCHSRVERERADAHERGLLVRYGDEPWAVPAVIWCGRVWLGESYRTEREAS